MGYPMTYLRVVSRNQLAGDYEPQRPAPTFDPRPMIAGDLRRLETDTLDKVQIKRYAKRAGVTKKQARALFEDFFKGGL